MRLSDELEILWQYAYGTPTGEVALAATALDGGGYLVGGMHNPQWQNLDYTTGLLLCLEEDGTLAWAGSYAVSAAGDVFRALLPRPDGGAVAVGSAINMGFFRADGWLAWVDGAGEVVQSRLTGDFTFNWHDEITDAMPTRDGGFVAAGTTDTADRPQQVWLMRFDAAGSLQWQCHYGSDSAEWGAWLAPAPGNGILVAGGTSDQGGLLEGWLAALDRYGRCCGTCPLLGTMPRHDWPVAVTLERPRFAVVPTPGDLRPAGLVSRESASQTVRQCPVPKR
jgi:hypothetical protein